MQLTPTPETNKQWDEWRQKQSAKPAGIAGKMLSLSELRETPTPVLQFHTKKPAQREYTHLNHITAPGAIITPDGQRLWTLEGWDYYTGEVIATPLGYKHPNERFSKQIKESWESYAVCEDLTEIKRETYDFYWLWEKGYVSNPNNYGIEWPEDWQELVGKTVESPKSDQYRITDIMPKEKLARITELDSTDDDYGFRIDLRELTATYRIKL